VLTVYLCVLYFFAVIGRQMYGDTGIFVSDTNNSIVKTTSWYAQRAQLNFDSVENSLLTLFFCCFSSGWESILHASLVMFEGSTVHYLYWLSFKVTVGLVVYPAVTSFIIQIYNWAWSESRLEKTVDRSLGRQFSQDGVSSSRQSSQDGGDTFAWTVDESCDVPVPVVDEEEKEVEKKDKESIDSMMPECVCTTTTTALHMEHQVLLQMIHRQRLTITKLMEAAERNSCEQGQLGDSASLGIPLRNF
jgi:hypothetical protein